MCAQVIAAVLVKALHGYFLDSAVHSLGLAICPRLVGLGEPMLDPVRFADQGEAHWPGIDGVPVSGLLCEFNTVIGENGMDLIGHGLEQVLQELPGRLSVGG
jgi:hypothetical protein